MSPDKAKVVEHMMALAVEESYLQLEAEIMILVQELDFHRARAAYYREEVRYLTAGEEEEWGNDSFD